MGANAIIQINDVPSPFECCMHFDMLISSQKDIVEIEKAYGKGDKADQNFCMRGD